MLKGKYSRYLKVLFILGVILLIGIATYHFIFKKDPNTNINTPEWRPYGQGKVFTKDLHKYVDSSAKDFIEHTLHDLIHEETPTLYTATIRSGTYSKKTLTNGQVVKEMLVDVDPAELTYKIIVSSHQIGSNSVNILCAPQEQQLNKSAECSDFERE